MKKLKSTLIVLIALSINATAQIPNYDFENWTDTITTRPAGWMTFGKITQVTPGFSGNYAIRIECDSANINAPGAILFGNPGGNYFSGGIPFAARPDSLVGFFQYDIKAGDTAWIAYSFKLFGIPISSDTNYITGTDTSGYVRLAFKVHYFLGVTPDSLILAVTSTNPNKPSLGSYILVDSLHFTNTVLAVPNGNFETWVNDTDAEPDGWKTSNRYYITNPSLPVTKTTDSYSGDYAIRIENVNTVAGLAEGVAFSGPFGNNGPLPGFPVSERELFFEGHYKFYPDNNDTMLIGVSMFKDGTQVGGGYIRSKIAKSSYTHFITPVNYYGFMGTPDSATVLLLSYNGGQYSRPRGNSVLYVDSLGFNNVFKLNQTITFGALLTKHVGDPAFNLTAFSSSGYPISYTSSNLDVATMISGSTLAIVGAGTSDITASQIGDDYYNPATPVIRTLTVLPNTGIDAVTSEMVRIYPNPAKDILFIQSNILMNSISIYDLQGRMINQYQPNSILDKIDISQLSSGLYLIKIQCGDTEYLRKIEKK